MRLSYKIPNSPLDSPLGIQFILKSKEENLKTREHLGIVGISGGGKSTLLKLLSGLYAPQNGYIEVVGEGTLEQIRRQVAVVMQNATLLPVSIRDSEAIWL